MKTLYVIINAVMLSVLLPGASFAEQQTAQPAAGGSSQSLAKSTGDSVHKVLPAPGKHSRDGSHGGTVADGHTETNPAAGAEVDSPIQLSRPLVYTHGKAPPNGNRSKSAPGAYTKQYQHHPGEKGGGADGAKGPPASGKNQAYVPSAFAKEQKAKFHSIATTPGTESELRPFAQEHEAKFHSIATAPGKESELHPFAQEYEAKFDSIAMAPGKESELSPIVRQPTPPAPGSGGYPAPRGLALIPARGRGSAHPPVIDGRTSTRSRNTAVIAGPLMDAPHFGTN